MPPAGHSAADMGAMNDHQKEAMEGMTRMDRDMMQGKMKDDADTAFICGMIAHHLGANVEIKYADNDWQNRWRRRSSTPRRGRSPK